jgi:uncharacterized protein YodC (DUF2158 family)
LPGSEIRPERATLNDFQVGDVVELKSGGPSMTIEEIGNFHAWEAEDQAKCVWFEKTTRKEGIFEFVTLVKATSDMMIIRRG